MVQRALIVGSFAAASVMGGITHAGPVGASRAAYVMTRPEPGYAQAAGWNPITRVPLRSGGSARVVVRPMVDYGLTLDRALSEQPARPWLTELQLANTTTIYIDPLDSYRDYAWRGIDENHSILKAKRLGLSRLALPTRVIRNPLAPGFEDATEPEILPRAIFRIRKPDTTPMRKVALAD